MLDLLLHLLEGTQRVQQRVDLVQHHEAFLAGLAKVVAPDGQIRPCDAGIGGQHEDHRMRAGQQAQGELGFGADGIQPGRVDDHQAALQQRMGVIDHCVAPGRHLHTAVFGHWRVVLRLRSVPETQCGGLLHADSLDAGDRGQCLSQRLRVARLQGHDLPMLFPRAQFSQRQAAQTGFDGQQRQPRRQVGFVAQLHRAHRGATRRGWQHAAARVGKEDGVDQFGLAARELGHEGQHQLFGRQAFAQGHQHRGVRVAQ